MNITANGTINIDQADLGSIIASDLTPKHLKGIFEAARDYQIGFMHFPRNHQKVDLERLNAAKAFVAIVGDDTDCSMGPDHFDAVFVRMLLEKAFGIAVISSAVIEDIYTLFAEVAGLCRKSMVIIETRPEHEMQWIARVNEIAPNTHLVVSTPKPEKASKHS
jgi:hypothetical protein